MKNRTIRFHEFGGPEVLRFESLDPGDPGEGELRVRIERSDESREASFRSGRYVRRRCFRRAIGYEAAGIARLRARVLASPRRSGVILPTFSMTRYGVYAERAIVPAHLRAARPHGLRRRVAAV